MRRMVRWLTPAGSLRAVLLVACLALIFMTEVTVGRIVWLVVLTGQAAVAEVAARATDERTREGRSLAWVLLLVEAVSTAVGAIVTGPDDSPLLPMLVAAPVGAALLLGVRGTVAIVAGQSVALTLTATASHAPARHTASATLEWVLLGIAFGGVCLLLPRDRESADALRWEAAQRLIDELGSLARELPTLDPAAAAEALLAECRGLVPVRSGAVLRSTSDDRLVPLALLGTSRIPWTHPLEDQGPVRAAWTTGAPHVERRAADTDPQGRRGDSALLVAPLVGKDGVLGVLVLDTNDITAYDEGQVELVLQAADHAAPRLEAALAFDVLRQTALMEERHRLAREMHDGVAQEIAAIGFEVDLLRRWMADTAPAGVEKVEHLRELVNSISSEVRIAMIDLRAGVSPDRGLTTALTSYLQSVAQATGMRVNLSLADSGFRLAGSCEEALYRVVHECVTALRTSGSTELSVSLEVEPPAARLQLDATPAVWLHGALHDWLQRHADDEGYELVLGHSLQVLLRTSDRMTA